MSDVYFRACQVKKVKRFLRQFHMNDSMVMVGGGGRAGFTKIFW